MPNVIILGHEGVAGPKKRETFEVEASLVHKLPKRVSKYGLPKHGIRLRDSGGIFSNTEIDTLHWIGHGNPVCLFLNSTRNRRASAKYVAAFIDALNPRRVVFWACNTGIRRVKGTTNKILKRECNTVGAVKEVESEQFNVDLIESFTFKVASAMNTTGVNIYGPPVGVGHDIAGIYGSFNENAGGSPQLVHWRSEGNKRAVTEDPTSMKYRKAVVSSGRIFRFICSYESSKRNTRCKYFGDYDI